MVDKHPENKNAEKRKRERIDFHVAITLNVRGKKIRYEETHDISMSGVFVYTAFPQPVGTVGEFDIHLSEVALQEHEIKGKFRVTSVSDKEGSVGMGLEFTEIDPDSSIELFNVIKLNTGAE